MDEVAQKIADMLVGFDESDSVRGAVLIKAAHKLDLACAIFCPDEFGESLGADDVEDIMIAAVNDRL